MTNFRFENPAVPHSTRDLSSHFVYGIKCYSEPNRHHQALQMTPSILQIVPEQIDIPPDTYDSIKVEVIGEGFAEDAEVRILGEAGCAETIRLSDTRLEAHLDMLEFERFTIGLMVLNDPVGFAPGTTSNVAPLAVSRCMPDPSRHIPF